MRPLWGRIAPGLWEAGICARFPECSEGRDVRAAADQLVVLALDLGVAESKSAVGDGALGIGRNNRARLRVNLVLHLGEVGRRIGFALRAGDSRRQLLLVIADSADTRLTVGPLAVADFGEPRGHSRDGVGIRI